jgi:hypothetical protein
MGTTATSQKPFLLILCVVPITAQQDGGQGAHFVGEKNEFWIN